MVFKKILSLACIGIFLGNILLPNSAEATIWSSSRAATINSSNKKIQQFLKWESQIIAYIAKDYNSIASQLWDTDTKQQYAKEDLKILNNIRTIFSNAQTSYDSELNNHITKLKQEIESYKSLRKKLSTLANNPENLTKQARDTNRMNDIKELLSGVEQYYQDHSYFPDSINEISPYIPKIPHDPKEGQTINGCLFWYNYQVGPNNYKLDNKNGAYVISTCFEDTKNIEKKAKTDLGNDPLRFEIGFMSQFVKTPDNSPTQTLPPKPKLVSRTTTSVTLTWEPVKGVSYNVKYSTKSVANSPDPYEQYNIESGEVTKNSITIKDLLPNTTYYFAVVTIDKTGMESEYFSDELAVPADTK